MFNKLKSINIYIADDKVGTLALTSENLCVFEYDADWIKNGYSISPFYLPLKKEVFVSKPEPFDGLFGVFNDNFPLPE